MRSNKANILYFYQYFGTPKGGWSTRVYEMCKRWTAKGHQVTVITSLYNKSDLTASGIYTKHIIDGITVYVINIRLSNKNKFYYRIYTFLAYAFWATLIGLFVRTNVIVASSGPITVGIPALIVKWLRFKPMVFEVRDLWPGGAIAFNILKNKTLINLALWFEKLCYKNSALVVSCSAGIDHSIVSRYPDTKTVIVPNAADVELFRYMELDPKKDDSGSDNYFVYTGTVGLIDNCEQILFAAKALQDKGRADIKILIIGDGNEKEQLVALNKEIGLRNVAFLGQMPKVDLIGYVRGSKGSILTVKPIPYMNHCSPNKIFDAFAAGIPILQTTQGWIKDLVEATGCGLNVEPSNPDHFADCMIRLVDDPQFFKQCCENSAKLGDEDFNRNHLANKMLAGILQTV